MWRNSCITGAGGARGNVGPFPEGRHTNATAPVRARAHELYVSPVSADRGLTRAARTSISTRSGAVQAPLGGPLLPRPACSRRAVQLVALYSGHDPSPQCVWRRLLPRGHAVPLCSQPLSISSARLLSWGENTESEGSSASRCWVRRVRRSSRAAKPMGRRPPMGLRSPETPAQRIRMSGAPRLAPRH